MTDRNLTEVAVILDRSGSMESIRRDMIGGFRRFVKDQCALPGRCILSLYQFNNRFETCFEERDIHNVGDLGLAPDGGTALFDAVGLAVGRIGERLRRRHEAERPGGVIVLIITDGEENASREFSQARVKQLIEHQESKYSWKFLYLSADLNAFGAAQGLGICRGQAAFYSANAIGSEQMYGGISASVGGYRHAVMHNSLGSYQAGLGGVFGDQGVGVLGAEQGLTIGGGGAPAPAVVPTTSSSTSTPEP